MLDTVDLPIPSQAEMTPLKPLPLSDVRDYLHSSNLIGSSQSNAEVLSYLKQAKPSIEKELSENFELAMMTIASINPDRMFNVAPDAYDARHMGIEEFKADILFKNRSIILERLKSPTTDDYLKNHVLSSLSIFLDIPDDRVISFADYFLDVVEKSPHAFEKYKKRKLVDIVVSKGSDGQRQRLFNVLKNQALHPTPNPYTIETQSHSAAARAEGIANLVGFFDLDEGSPTREELGEFFAEELWKYKLDSKEILDVWNSGIPKHQRGELTARNLSDIYTLEALRPGMTHLLWTEFGIANFARYPTDLLVDQYDNRDNAELKYGVALYAQEDHNGAFYGNMNVLQNLHADLKGLGYGIRIFEAGSRREATRALVTADKRYGEQNKISFALVSGHGLPDSLEFGQGPSGELHTDDLIRGRSRRTKEVFVRNPTVILNACSTGDKDGLAKNLSLIGAEVIGPRTPASLKSIKVTDVQGKLAFNVEYNMIDGDRFVGSETDLKEHKGVYKNGLRVMLNE